ncbi:hypothetical protein BJY00DRAFT_305481 [Aspergillus carlsbadensis]|nr:hypothetical protein BJY00DRAFT_305481 [Aspergillus carlsbadensis]
MDILQALENLLTVACILVGHEGPFQDLLQRLVANKPLLGLQGTKPTAHPYDHKTFYLVKLEDPISTSSKVQHLAKLSRLPEEVPGTGTGTSTGTDNASFCLINGVERLALILAICFSSRCPRLPKGFRPTFIRTNRAPKSLATNSIAPFLGIDSTLPHNRPSDATQAVLPAQDQCPVWYFFYGSLADASILGVALKFPNPLVYRSARVTGAQLRLLGGKRKVLLDGAGTVPGWAYQVFCAEQEDALRAYATDRFEVVRCAIEMDYTGERALGLTFRVVGGLD